MNHPEQPTDELDAPDVEVDEMPTHPTDVPAEIVRAAERPADGERVERDDQDD